MGVVAAEEVADKLERRLGLMDLLAIGIGGTVGSGVFVLAGAIANAKENPAGPAVVISFLLAVSGPWRPGLLP
jgi:APA family basic amino acid/polyamine antiporter